MLMPFFRLGFASPNTGSYRLARCDVYGEKLDSMGEPHVFTHEGTEVHLCCNSCLDDFSKEPAKHMAKQKP
jgi:hypothetical protein